MSDITKTSETDWQLGRDGNNRILSGTNCPEGGVLIGEVVLSPDREDAVHIRTEQEAANVITFLRMAFRLDGEGTE